MAAHIFHALQLKKVSLGEEDRAADEALGTGLPAWNPMPLPTLSQKLALHALIPQWLLEK